MKNLVLLLLLCFAADTSVAQITKVTIGEYQKKALMKTSQLGEKIRIITDNQSSRGDVKKAINLACGLFINEEALVEVSSLNSKNKQSYKIRDYLNRLKQLNYDKIEIEWTNIQYVSDLRLGVDGFYYGVITIEQRFLGFIDGVAKYGDVTNKNIEVVLKSYTKEDNGENKIEWDVFLSDIGVVQTK